MSDLRKLSQEQRLSRLADAAQDHAFVVLDPQGYIVDWPLSAERLFGWSATEVTARHSSAILTAAGSQSGPVSDITENSAETGGSVAVYWQEQGDGSGFHVEDRSYSLYDGDTLIGYGKILRRIPDEPVVTGEANRAQLQAEATEKDTAERLKFVLEAGRIGDWDLDLITNTIRTSLIHDQCFGYPDGAPEWTLAMAFSHIHEDDRDWVRQELDAAIAQSRDLCVECRVVWPDSSVHWILSQGRVYSSEGQPTQLTGLIQDISSRKRAEEKVLNSSLYDPLTALPNRTNLFEYAVHALAHSKRMGQCAAVFLMDLDRFKVVNDTHGHGVGDAVLMGIADRLQKAVRDEDFIVRVGGDEFLILFPDIGGVENARNMAKLIIDTVSEPYRIQGQLVAVSTSIGISLFPGNGDTIDALTSNADLAMYQAKQNGRNNFHFYSPALEASSRLARTVEQELRSALINEGFHLMYQPVMDLNSGQLISVEALLRWHDTEIGPDTFVPIAEATGIIGSIGRWLFSEASQQYVDWLEAGLPPVPIAVNVSVIQFRDRDFVNRFQRTLDHHGIGPEALQIELTETAVMDDVDHAIAQLAELKRRGVSILLDDFGTGQSSLTYLARFPLNKVKIDKSFVVNLNSNASRRSVTDAMVALAHTLGLKVVAEGIENEAILDYVRAQGCHQGQGFYLGRPMSGDTFAQWHREYLNRPETV